MSRVRVKCPNVEPRRTFIGVVDPHGHIHEEEVPQFSALYPLFGLGCRRCESVIQINTEVESFFTCRLHHFPCMMDVVANGLFAEHMEAGLETLHGRLVVMPSVLRAGGADRYGLQL